MTIESDEDERCAFCGDIHETLYCPRVKAVEFNDDGMTVRRVEFFSPVEMSKVAPETTGPDYPRLKPSEH